MRKKAMSIDEAKAHIQGLSGQSLKISINKGRRKIVRYEGKIGDLFPSVFTLHISGDKNVNLLSCSYRDVVCGQIQFKSSISQKIQTPTTKAND